jgi:hypothetical protein
MELCRQGVGVASGVVCLDQQGAPPGGQAGDRKRGCIRARAHYERGAQRATWEEDLDLDSKRCLTPDSAHEARISTSRDAWLNIPCDYIEKIGQQHKS